MSTQHRAPPRNGAPRRPTWLLATMLVMTAGPLAPTAARAQAGPQPQVSGAPDVRGTVQSFDDERLPPVTVTATRDARRLLETPAAVGIVSGRTIRDTAPAHPQQLLGQVPGVAVAVTNGEGHTTAIRQGFTTAPLYLFLEDGLPIRATGFFNHNALYEINLPMAGRVEVIRGPGSALYGSDAIGGIVNVLTGAPAAQAGIRAHAEAGSFGWRRLLAQADSGEGQYGALRADLNLTRTDGWRERTAYDRSGGTLQTLLAGRPARCSPSRASTSRPARTRPCPRPTTDPTPDATTFRSPIGRLMPCGFPAHGRAAWAKAR
jgi:outer membrane cobalamin receptor